MKQDSIELCEKIDIKINQKKRLEQAQTLNMFNHPRWYDILSQTFCLVKAFQGNSATLLYLAPQSSPLYFYLHGIELELCQKHQTILKCIRETNTLVDFVTPLVRQKKGFITDFQLPKKSHLELAKGCP